MTYNNSDEIIEKKIDSFLSRYQIGLETRMRGNDCIFESVNFLYHKFHKTNFKRGGLYIDSLDWIKKEEATINPKTDDDKCFEDAETIPVKFEEIKKRPIKIYKDEAI